MATAGMGVIDQKQQIDDVRAMSLAPIAEVSLQRGEPTRGATTGLFGQVNSGDENQL
jgi:hypothetical protein